MLVVPSVKVTCDVEDQRLGDSARSAADSKKKVTVAPQQTSTPSSVLGFCTLDLMPILLGNDLSRRNGERAIRAAFKIILTRP